MTISLPTPIRAALAATLLLAGCASAPSAPAEARLAVQDPETPEVAPPRPADLPRQSPAELDLWNDPAFKRHFIQSYAANVAIEPPVTFDERDVIMEMREFLRKDRIDRAIRLIERNLDEEASAALDQALGNLFFQLASAVPEDDWTEDQVAAHEVTCAEYEAKAIASYRTAVSKWQEFRRAHKNLGLIYVRNGEFQKALPHLSKVIELGGGDALGYGLLGYAYAANKDHLSAETAYRMASLLDPSSFDWKRGLAFSLLEQRRYPDVVAICDVLLRERPDAALIWKIQGNAYLGLGESLKAAENFEFLERLGGADAKALGLLGDIYTSERLYEMAASAYLRALSASTDPEASFRQAKGLIARRAHEEALSLVNAIEASYGEGFDDEQRKDVLRLRARLAVSKGDGGEAEAAILREILAIDPRDGDALILLAMYHARTGDVDRAINEFEYAANLDAFEAQATLEHGKMLVRERRYREALPKLQRSYDLEPTERLASYLEQVGQLAQKQQD